MIAVIALAACSGDDSSPDGGSSLSPSAASPTVGPEPDSFHAESVLGPDYLGDASQFLVELDVIPGRPNEAIVLDLRGPLYRIALDGSFPPQLWGDLTDRVTYDEVEQGLLSLAFSPNFEEDGRVYVYYTPGSPTPSFVGRYQATAETLDVASEEAVIEVEQFRPTHNGGTLVFGHDGYLLLSLGDGGAPDDPMEQAQELDSLNGSVLRLDVSGDSGHKVPPDNPFVGVEDAREEIWAYGFRNPWRMSVDSETGDVWLGDVGEISWEEVDKVVAGGNYGWDCHQGPVEYELTGEPDQCSGKEFVEPRAWYEHQPGTAITGGLVYRGSEIPELYGWYIYADFYQGTMRAFDTNSADSLPLEIGDDDLNISSFTQLPDGEFVIVTFSQGIFKLARD